MNPADHFTLKSLILFVVQVLVLFLLIGTSLYNLSRGGVEKDLWISILSSSSGYLLPNPKLERKALQK